jgi:hypothetical protein
MAKKKQTQNELEELLNTELPSVEPEVKAAEVVQPKETPVTEAPKPSTPKKRIRIRKKATKKLSAAIICMDPSIQRFI